MLRKKSILAVLSAVAVLFSALAGSALSAFAETAEASNESVNLIEYIDTVKGITQNITTGAVTESTNPFGTTQADAVHDGNTTTHKDVNNSADWTDPTTPVYAGVCMAMKVPVYAEKAVLYSGISSHVDVLKVYASDDLSTLYDESNRVAYDLQCNGEAKTVTIGKEIEYMAVIYTDSLATSNRAWRPKEFEIWGYALAELGEPPVNLLTDHMESIKGVSQSKTDGTVTDSTRFDGVLELLVDGNTTTNKDVNGMLCAVLKSQNSTAGTYNEGVQIMLDKAYTLSKIQLYQGISSHADYVRVYASEKLGDLYKDSSLLFDNQKANGQLDLKTDVKARHIAILVTQTTDYAIARVKEYVVLGDVNSGTEVDEDLSGGSGGGSEEDPSGAVNLIDKIAYVEGIIQYASGEKEGEVELSNNPFGTTQANAMYDGRKGNNQHVDVSNYAKNETNPLYAGVLMTLSAPVQAEKAVLYSGLSDRVDVLKVYASDSLDDLYTDANLIDEELECNGSAVTVAIDKEIRYMAVILTRSLINDNWRPKEFEIWGTAIEGATEELELQDAFDKINPALQAHGATISQNSENNILFKSRFSKVLQRSCGYTVREYGIIVIPEQFINEVNPQEGAELVYGNRWVVTASNTVAEGDVLKANEEFTAELRGSTQGVYPSVNFAYRSYAIYSKEGCEDVILYSDTTVRSVWGVARSIATAILEARDSDKGLTASINYTDKVTDEIAAADLSTIASADLYTFICQNVAAVTEVASKQ